MRYSNWYPWIFSIALSAMGYGFALSGGSFSVLVLAQGLVLLVSILGFLFPGYSRLRRRNIMLLGVFSIAMMSTIFFNTENYSENLVSLEFALAHVAGIIGMIFAVQWAATNLDSQALLRHLTLLLTPLIILAIAVSQQAGGLIGRQSPFGIHPNWWGELGFALTACALALPHWKARALPLAVAMLLFFLVQSRGALLASVGSMGLYVLLTTRWKRLLNSLQLVLASMSIIIIGAGLLVYQYYAIQAWLFLQNEVLLLNDPYRGMDTGLTGRLGGWQEAFSVFMAQPFFGNGIDTLTHVHNGLLRLAGEGGLILLAAMLLLIGIGLREALRAKNYIAISIIGGYLIYAMTYPRMLNMNLASALFYLSLFPWKISYEKCLSQGLKAGRTIRHPDCLQAS